MTAVPPGEHVQEKHRGATQQTAPTASKQEARRQKHDLKVIDLCFRLMQWFGRYYQIPSGEHLSSANKSETQENEVRDPEQVQMDVGPKEMPPFPQHGEDQVVRSGFFGKGPTPGSTHLFTDNEAQQKITNCQQVTAHFTLLATEYCEIQRRADPSWEEVTLRRGQADPSWVGDPKTLNPKPYNPKR